MNQTTQNLSNPIDYSQLDTTYNISQDEEITATPDNMTQALTSASSHYINDINENQPMQRVNSPNLYVHTITPNHPLLPIQDDQTPRFSNHLTHSAEYAFFYRPCNDFQMYHIICKEIPLSFELVSQLINDSTHNHVQSNDIYVFYHEQTDSKKIYQITCEMVSHTFIFQFLNKIIYGIEFNQYEKQQQEFSKSHQENLKFYLKKDLIHYLASKRIYNQNDSLYWNFIQDSCIHNMNSNTGIFNDFQQYTSNTLPVTQSFTSQRDNNYQLIGSKNNDDNI